MYPRIKNLITNFMEELKDIIPPEDAGGKENKNKEYKSNFTKFHEQKAEEEREKIKKLM